MHREDSQPSSSSTPIRRGKIGMRDEFPAGRVTGHLFFIDTKSHLPRAKAGMPSLSLPVVIVCFSEKESDVVEKTARHQSEVFV